MAIMKSALSTVRPGGDVTCDFAQSRYAETWLRHPVYGDPSFDAFERVPGNPIHRGIPSYEWPVNGFLFHDPVSGNDYIYVGDYAWDYGMGAKVQFSRCILYRSTDGMKSWSNLGVVLQGDPALFHKGGHTPDASVVFDAGIYHMVYDWAVGTFAEEGGIAYAWAEKPEGPWHFAPKPITLNLSLPKLLGKYQRTYAATLIRRKNDWLIAGMMDSTPAWCLFIITAPTTAGPWSERRIVLHVESDIFHPPLMEFFPVFVRDGFLYAPATSVALNRNFNILFRVPLDCADDPAAWEMARHGSLWHSETVENEHYGLWGQTFSASIDERDTMWVMFNSRDEKGLGTVNLARRPWNQPMRPQGFVFNGHQGPDFTCLRQTFREFELDAIFNLKGTAQLIWDWHGALAPDKLWPDATLHAMTRTRFHAVELSPTGWAIVRADESGGMERLASGAATNRGTWELQLNRRANGEVQLCVNGREIWHGVVAAGATETYPGAIGWWVEPNTTLAVDKFQITGKRLPARVTYLGLDALLGAGERVDCWNEVRSPEFRLGIGWVSQQPNARVKWNVTGTQLTLWSPRGPGFGKAEILLDGKRMAMVNLHAR